MATHSYIIIPGFLLRFRGIVQQMKKAYPFNLKEYS